jgi:hypothetical protein
VVAPAVLIDDELQARFALRRLLPGVAAGGEVQPGILAVVAEFMGDRSRFFATGG